MFARILGELRSLTLTNALVIVLLGMALGPAYLAWRVINDEQLLSLIFSNFEERALPNTDCAMRVASLRAAKPTYYISLSWAYAGSDRWSIGVSTPTEPSREEAELYCKTLVSVVEYLRNPHEVEMPKFPHSTRGVFTRPHK